MTFRCVSVCRAAGPLTFQHLQPLSSWDRSASDNDGGRGGGCKGDAFLWVRLWKSCSNKNCSLIMSWDHPTWTPTFKNRNQVPYKTNTSLMLSQLIHQCINLVTQLPHRLAKTKRSWGYCNFAKKTIFFPYLLQPKFDYTIAMCFCFGAFFGWCVFIQEGTWIRNQVFPVDKIRWLKRGKKAYAAYTPEIQDRDPQK